MDEIVIKNNDILGRGVQNNLAISCGGSSCRQGVFQPGAHSVQMVLAGDRAEPQIGYRAAKQQVDLLRRSGFGSPLVAH